MSVLTNDDVNCLIRKFRDARMGYEKYPTAYEKIALIRGHRNRLEAIKNLNVFEV